MADIILFDTLKQVKTVPKRVRSMASYALVCSIKHSHNVFGFFRANFCSRRITNNVSVVDLSVENSSVS